ncbi:MAG: sialate O-acetylesterase [Planctomycetota bacterium]|jgi:hypothetical protein
MKKRNVLIMVAVSLMATSAIAATITNEMLINFDGTLVADWSGAYTPAGSDYISGGPAYIWGEVGAKSISGGILTTDSAAGLYQQEAFLWQRPGGLHGTEEVWAAIPQSFSAEMVFKPETGTAGNGEFDTLLSFGLYSRLFYDGSADVIGVQTYDVGTSAWVTTDAGTPSGFDDVDWHHYGLVYDAATRTLEGYIDNQLVVSIVTVGGAAGYDSTVANEGFFKFGNDSWNTVNTRATYGMFDAVAVSTFTGNFNGAADFVITEVPNLLLTAPKTRAVYQRDDQNIAMVPVEGTYLEPATAIEARTVVMAGYGGTDTGWQVIDASPGGGFFSAALPVSVGGWYSIEVRAFTGSEYGETASVDKIGVGEVFITSGQSNSANYGSPPLTPTHDIVSAWIGGSWRHGYDPQPIASAGGGVQTGSPWSRLGDILVDRFGCPIGFVSVGIGATRVDEWVPGAPTNYYSRIQSAISSMGVNGMRSILWHQGESDSLASTSAAAYANRLNSIITQSRADAGWDVPWGVALASYHPSSTPAQEAPVRTGQELVIAGDPLVFQGADTDDFHNLGYLYDTVHFNAAGLYEHAKSWERVILKNFFPCDYDADGDVDIDDLAVFAGYWLSANCIETYDCEEFDFLDDDKINLNDFSICAQNWLD